MIDTLRPVETPEGIELPLRVAGPAVRGLAALLDAFIRSLGYWGAAVACLALGEAGMGLFLLILFLGEWFYPVAFEVWGGGRTPGKRVFGLQVLHADGTPIGWAASIVRNLLRFADFLPFGYGLGIVSMLFHPDGKRLGDLAAGTLVVHREPKPTGARVAAMPPIPPPTPLSLDEQRAVIEFAERLPTWTDARAIELSSFANPLTGVSGRQGVDRLVAMANWLLGRK